MKTLISKYKVLFVLIIILNVAFNSKLNATFGSTILKTSDSTSSGYYIFGVEGFPNAILDIYGNSIQKEKLENLPLKGINFNVHPNGYFSYYANAINKFLILDPDLNVVDSIGCVGSHLGTDYHDFSILSNGNYLVFGRDIRVMDLSLITENGQPNTTVNGFEVQEIDKNTKQVVFSWNTFDHISILDATEDIDLSNQLVLYCHLNSIMQDTDGNFILCFRHLDELIKVKKSDGSIMWRLGGSKSKNNQFTFIDDTNSQGFYGFSHQHDPTRLENGNILLFDNGNLKNPTFSRAVEYQIDENNKTAKKVWEYIHYDSMYSFAMCNAQRLNNGNTLINFNNFLTEVDSKGKIVQESIIQSVTYRVFKHPVFMDFNTRKINSISNFNFSDNKYNTGTNLQVTSLIEAGDLTIEKHRIAMLNPPVDTNLLISKYLPYRLVVKSQNPPKFTGILKIDLSSFGNIKISDSIYVLKREAETKGIFNPIPYSINHTTNQLEIQINGTAEILIALINILEVPILTYPNYNQTNIPTDPMLKWQNVVGATNYSIQISKDNFKTILKEFVMTNSSCQLQNLENNSMYYWRVAARASNKSSEFSNIWQFKTKMIFPNLIYPANESKFFDIEKDSLYWSKQSNASFYSIQIAENIGFTIGLINISNIKNNVYYPTSIQLGKTFYWRVKSENNEGSSEWSEVYSFSTLNEKPLLLAPQNSTLNSYSKIKFIWQQKSPDDYYTIQISNNIKFTNLIVDYTYLDTNTFEVSKLNPSTSYYWRIKIEDSNKKSSWSDVWSFRTKLKTPINYIPKNGEILDQMTIILEWLKINEASDYNLEISNNQDFKNIEIKELVQSNNSIELMNLKESFTYYWRVQAVSSNNISDYSTFTSFVTPTKTKLNQPKLIYPDNKSFDHKEIILFEWEKDSSLINKDIAYKLQISMNNDFSETFVDTTILEEKYVNENPFVNGVTYYWRLMTIENNGYSKWSDIWSFTIRDIVDLSAPLIINPDNNFESNREFIDFKWTSQKNIENYILQVSRDEQFENMVFDLTTNSKFYKLSGLDKNFKYFWRVAFVLDNQKFWSETRKFSFKNQINDIEELKSEDDNLIVNQENSSILIKSKKEISNVTIYDLNGNEILGNKINKLDDFTFEVKNLSNSVYFVLYKSEKLNYFKKIIVN